MRTQSDQKSVGSMWEAERIRCMLQHGMMQKNLDRTLLVFLHNGSHCITEDSRICFFCSNDAEQTLKGPVDVL